MEIKTIQSVGNDIITTTEERATLLVNGIMENNAKGIDLYFANCELIKELRETNGFYLLGYTSFKELAESVFDSGETQAKNMCLIAKYFGKENSDKSWTIVDKELLKKFSATQLLYIGQLKGYDGNITETVANYGLTFNDKGMCNVTTAKFRELVKYEKNHDKMLTLNDVETLKSQLPQKDETKVDDTNVNETKADETKADETKATNTKANDNVVPKEQFEIAKKQVDDYVTMLTQVEEVVFNNKLNDKRKIEILQNAFNELKKSKAKNQ